MSRSLSAAYLTELGKRTLRPAFLVHAETTTAVKVWSGIGSITVDSITYTGVGDLGDISNVTETTDLRATNLSFTLSGLPAGNVSWSLDDTDQGAVVTVYLVFFDENQALVDTTPITVYKGIIDTISISLNKDAATIQVNTINRLAILGNTNTSRYTPEDFRAKNSGNPSLDFIPAIQDKEFIWKE